MKFCPKCGTELKEETKWCGKCGHSFKTKVTDEDQATPSNELNENNNEKLTSDKSTVEKKSKKIPATLGILFVLFLGVLMFFGYGYFFGSDDPEAEEMDFSLEISSGYWVLSDEIEEEESSTISFEAEQLTMALYLDEESYKVAENGENAVSIYEVEEIEADGNRGTLEITDRIDQTSTVDVTVTQTGDRKELTLSNEGEDTERVFTEVSEEEYTEAGGSNLRELDEEITSNPLETIWGNSYITFGRNGIEYDRYTFLSGDEAQSHLEEAYIDADLENTEGLLVWDSEVFYLGYYGPPMTPEIVSVILEIDYDEDSQVLSMVTEEFDGNANWTSREVEFVRQGEGTWVVNDEEYHLADDKDYADSSIEKVDEFDFEVSDIFGYYTHHFGLGAFYIDDTLVYAPDYGTPAEYGGTDDSEDIIFNVEDIDVDGIDVTFSGEGQSITFRVNHYENSYDSESYDLISDDHLLLYNRADEETGQSVLPGFDPNEYESSSDSNEVGGLAPGYTVEQDDLWGRFVHRTEDNDGYEFRSYIEFRPVSEAYESWTPVDMSNVSDPEIPEERLEELGILGGMDLSVAELDNPNIGESGMGGHFFNSITSIEINEETNEMTVQSVSSLDQMDSPLYNEVFEFIDRDTLIHIGGGVDDTYIDEDDPVFERVE